jgi:hypothetical protein
MFEPENDIERLLMLRAKVKKTQVWRHAKGLFAQPEIIEELLIHVPPICRPQRPLNIFVGLSGHNNFFVRVHANFHFTHWI